MRLITTTVTRFAALAFAAVLFAAVLAAPSGAAPYDNAQHTVVVATATPGAVVASPDGHAGVNDAEPAQATSGPGAAAASPDGHAGVNSAHVEAVAIATDSHTGLNPNGNIARVHGSRLSSPEPLASTTGTASSGDETPWLTIGLGILGAILLASGTTLFVRRHGGDGRHAAAGV